MPPRWLSGLIVLFWLTTTAWLFWRDLWPSWRPGEPPPFHIDDVEEVKKNGTGGTDWTVERGKVGAAHLDKVFNALTSVDYHKDDDTYSLHARFNVWKPHKPKPIDVGKDLKIEDVGKDLKIEVITSEYRVTRAGCLQSLKAEVEGKLQLNRRRGNLRSLFGSFFPEHLAQASTSSPSGETVSLRLWGEVRNHQFTGHCSLSLGKAQSKPIDLPTTTVSYTGSVLMPLHPVNRISGLRADQRWRQPLVDPLRDAIPGLSNSVRSLNAHVLPQPEKLQIGDIETNCLVIEYTNDENEPMGRTWVEQSSNRVMQQEAILEDDRWLMIRNDPGGARKGSSTNDRHAPMPLRNAP